jgi:hypothetical protein
MYVCVVFYDCKKLAVMLSYAAVFVVVVFVSLLTE